MCIEEGEGRGSGIQTVKCSNLIDNNKKKKYFYIIIIINSYFENRLKLIKWSLFKLKGN